MERNRFVQYKTNQQKYTLLFLGQGLRRIFTDLRYTGVAILLILLEVKAYFVICDMLDTMKLWPMLFQLYKKVLIFPLAVFFAFAVIELGRPRGFRRIMREIEKITELLNGDKEAPILISRKKIKGKKTERWIFDSYGIPYSIYKKNQKAIESALDVGIIRITEGSDGHKVEMVLAVHPGRWPQKVPWEDKNLKEGYSKLPLGVNRYETVFLNLSETPHAIINGRTGSGKTIAMKSLCYGAIMKGYEVYLVDFKGGVDYGPVWENHTRLICDNEEFIAEIHNLVAALTERLGRLRQFGEVNVDAYNKANPTSPMKRIILFVDELGECLDKSGMNKEQRETVDQITQGLNTLCRLGRAAGISCILSTQRGSADLISGQIRNTALKIVGQCDDNLSLLTIGTADAKNELIYPGQFMDENKNMFQGFYADYTALLRKQEAAGRIGVYGYSRPEPTAKEEKKSGKKHRHGWSQKP